MSWEQIEKEFKMLPAFIYYFNTMNCLNKCIDTSKVPHHPIMEFSEFKDRSIGGEPLWEYYETRKKLFWEEKPEKIFVSTRQSNGPSRSLGLYYKYGKPRLIGTTEVGLFKAVMYFFKTGRWVRKWYNYA